MERKAIQTLDRYTADKIAAGEVVERPISVIKELVENALDSGATSVFTEILSGGQELIRISDNGCGISEEELPLAVKRFATSKISSFDDLEKLSSLGFRGEALPSIGAVSHLEIVSKTRDEEFAHKIIVEGSKVQDIRLSPGDDGTAVTVTRLFFNTPARKKFQRSVSYETSQISQLLSHLAISRRDVHFRLKSGGKILLNYPQSMKCEDCLLQIWNLESKNRLASLSSSRESVSVTGTVCEPAVTRSVRSEMILFVNGRLVRNSQIFQAVVDGYAPFLAPRRFPLAYIAITLPPHMLDVNVHPAKTEVRFADARTVYGAVREAVFEAVKTFSMPGVMERVFSDGQGNALSYEQSTGEITESPHVFGASFPKTDRVAQQSPLYEPLQPAYVSEKPSLRQVSQYLDFTAPSETAEDLPGKAAAENGKTDDRVFVPITQLYDTYILGKLGADVILIDQHAAHEKIVYEYLKNAEKNPAGQGLLLPEVLELSPALSSMLTGHLELLRRLGFIIEEFGEHTFSVRSLPYFVGRDDFRDFIVDVISSLDAKASAEEKLESLKHRIACRSAVKANQKLSFDEMYSLYEQLLQLREPFFCPHGRPVMYNLTKEELEKIFKRR